MDNKTIIDRINQAENFLIKAGEIINTLKFDISPPQPENKEANNPTVSPNPPIQPPYNGFVKQPPQTINIKNPLDYLPEDIATRLTAEVKGNFWIIKPKQFLGSENFATLASEIRGMGGEYCSMGKDSHFKVPVKKAE